MPTGFTAPIYENQPITLRTFMLRAARGMMPLVTLRDQSIDAQLPDMIEPSRYYADTAARDRAALAAVTATTPEEANRRADEEYERAIMEHSASLIRNDAMRARYEAMRADVEAWTPPTPEHEGLKRFAIEQLSESLKFDCGDFAEPERRDGAAWRSEEIARLLRSIVRAEQGQREEEERAAFSTRWLSALRGSLPAT